MDFYKIQIISSIIPFYSTFFVSIVTMFQLTKNRASLKLWMRFILIFLGSGFVAGLLLNVILVNQHKFVQIVIPGVMFAIANYYMVKLQKKSNQD